jgi:hypothetical protein
MKGAGDERGASDLRAPLFRWFYPRPSRTERHHHGSPPQAVGEMIRFAMRACLGLERLLTLMTLSLPSEHLAGKHMTILEIRLNQAIVSFTNYHIWDKNTCYIGNTDQDSYA